MQCTAHNHGSGVQCRAKAIAGAVVCRMHGGAAPQVKAKARQRLLAAADPAAARLIELINDRTLEPRDTLAAIRELFNRAGLGPVDTSATTDNTGQVLWEEFVQIHRKRFGTDDQSE